MLALRLIAGLRAAVYLIALVFVAFGFGRPAVAWSGLHAENPILRAATAIGMGLSAIGLASIAAGCAGVLAAAFVITIALAGVLLAWPHADELAGAARALAGTADRWTVYAFVFLAMPALLTICPPIYGDEVTYHTFFPEEFARTGSIPLGGPSLHLSYPLLTEALATPGVIAGVPEAARADQFLFTLLTVVLLVGFAVQRRVSPWVAPVLFVASPLVLLSAGIGYVSSAKAFQQLVVGIGFLEIRNGRGAVVVGFLLGAFLWTKQVALAFCAFLGFLWVLGRGLERRLVFTVLLVAGLVHAPHLVTNAIQTGDPLFPYGGALFPGRGWNSFFILNYSKLNGRLATVTWTEKAAFLASLIAGHDETNLEREPLLPHVGWLLPLAFLAAWRRPESRLPLASCGFYVALWIGGVAPLATRAMMPVLPLLCFLEAEGLEELAASRRGLYRGLTAALVGVLFFFHFPIRPLSLVIPFVTGQEDEEAYFVRAWGNMYRMHKLMDRLLAPGTPVLAVYSAERALTHCRLVLSHDLEGVFVMASAATRAAIERHSARIPALTRPGTVQLPVITTREAARAELERRGLTYVLVNEGLGLPLEITLIPLLKDDLEVMARVGRVTLYRLRPAAAPGSR